jgi:hypothetical protein
MSNTTPVRRSARLVKVPDAPKKIKDVVEPQPSIQRSLFPEVPKQALEDFYSIRFENTNYSPYISYQNVTDETSFMKFLINLRNSKKNNKINWAYDDIEGFLDGTVRAYEDGFENNYEENKKLNPWARMAKILITGAYYE